MPGTKTVAAMLTDLHVRRLKALLSYDPETGLFRAAAAAKRKGKIGQRARFAETLSKLRK